jgi:hypothetical protein
VVERRLHDAPGLLDAVLPGEVLVVADHRGMKQHRVWLRRLAQLADGVVEPAAALDTEIFGHRDLHAGHALAVPQVGERDVGEAQVLELDDRLLAEEVIDAQDLALAQQPVQPGVQLAG